MADLKNKLSQTAQIVENRMRELLPSQQKFSDSKLAEAMSYSAMTNGKRVRPFLVMATTEIFSNDENIKKAALDIAATMEFIHVYSLIHDDLPAMDDDDFRRGEPSCHKKFDEATAILAGDSLLTFAFEILSSDDLQIPDKAKCQLINLISKAIGFEGMAGGQMLDLEAQNKNLNQEQIFHLHHLKTGKMFIAAIKAGGILGGASEEKLAALENYGTNFGIAFQIKDDLLDFEENKITPKNKPDPASIVNLIGLDESIKQLKNFEAKAIKDLEVFGLEAELLRDLVKLISAV